jgi:predicted MFS family arabinose efflux permease
MPRRIATTLYAFNFLSDFVLLYPVYALLFADTGLSDAQISSLFVVWSVCGIVFEVPTGALADAVSRRLLVCLAPLLSGAAFALWVWAPGYWSFALGFVLWGLGGTLSSGALEALVYEELERVGAEGRYAAIIGRAEAVTGVAILSGTAAAAPVLDAGGYPAVGIASVAVCVLAALVATRFPEHRTASVQVHEDRASDDAEPGLRDTLRDGLRLARHDPRVRHALLIIPAITAVWGALEEYTPLLARDTGVSTATVPLLLVLIAGGEAIGGLLAGAAQRLSTRAVAYVVAGAGVAMGLGALSGRPVGIVAVGAAFAAFTAVGVVAGTRLQQGITGKARATVTSLASAGTDVGTIAVYGLYAGLAPLGHATVFALLSVPYLGVAVWIGRHRAELDPREPQVIEV